LPVYLSLLPSPHFSKTQLFAVLLKPFIKKLILLLFPELAFTTEASLQQR